MSASQSWLKWFKSAGRPTSRRHPASPARLGSRLCRLEPLEQRMVLSVISPMGVPFEIVAIPDSAPAEEVASLSEKLRIGVWTAEQIEDVGKWAESQSWPEGITVDADFVRELAHMPLRTDPRGGYRTVLNINPATQLSTDDAIVAIEELEFVDFARLESQCVIQYTPQTQELYDALTWGESDAPIMSTGAETRAADLGLNVRVGMWSKEPIEDVATWLNTRDWQEELGTLDAERVTVLTSYPLRTDPRGGYRTVVCIDVSGDIATLDRMNSIEYARLDAESVIQYTPRSEQLRQELTWGRSTAPIQTAMVESTELLELDTFRADQAYSGMDGSGYAIAILDTGIDTDHDFFDGRIVAQEDFTPSDDGDAEDTAGHGTHIAGIAAGYDEQGNYSGVAPGADIVALKVFKDVEDGGEGNFGYLEAGLAWLIDYADVHNVVAVNMSLSARDEYGISYNYDTPQQLFGIDDELAQLVELGVIVVSAAGNDFYANGSEPGVGYPAADPNSIAVSAVYDADLGRRPPVGYVYSDGSYANTTAADRVTPYSQRHETLTTVMAPGELTTAAWLNNGTDAKFGTSMAAAHIAGMAVLAKQIAMEELDHNLTHAQFVDLLQYTGETINDGDDEDDNVTNTDVDFKRADMLALADELLYRHWVFDANDDPAPGNQANDQTDDTFRLDHGSGYIYVTINGTLVDYIPDNRILVLELNGSNDNDEMKVYGQSGFHGEIRLNGQNNTGDIAIVYESIYDDYYVTRPLSMTFYGGCDYDEQTELHDPDTAQYTVTAEGFRETHGYATIVDGGIDGACMYGSAGNDEMLGYPTWYSAVYDSVTNPTYYNRVKSFEHVYFWGEGGSDIFYIHDTPGNDTFTFYGEDNYGHFDYGDYGYFKCWDFYYLHAYADYGGDDAASFIGTSGDETAYRNDEYMQFYRPNATGYDFYCRAKYFEEVTAQGNGGYDKAYLYDTTDDDDLTAEGNWVELSAAVLDRLYRLEDFDLVKAYSVNGGDDDTDITNPLSFTLSLYGDWDA